MYYDHMFLNEFDEEEREVMIAAFLSKGSPFNGDVQYLTQGRFGKVYLIKMGDTGSRVAKCPHFIETKSKIELKLLFQKAFYELEMTNRVRLNPWFNTFFDVKRFLHWPFFISRLWDCTLSDLIQDPTRWNLEDKLQVAILITRGLLTAQEVGLWAHQDLKPENIFINDLRGEFVNQGKKYSGNEGIKYSVKIGDLGMANAFLEFALNSASRPYQAPEQYSPDQISMEVSKKMDVFALGVIFHEMFTDGYHPLGIKTTDVWPTPLDGQKKWTHETIWKKWALNSKKELNLLSHVVSPFLKDKIFQMLSVKALDRPSLVEIFDTLCKELCKKNKHRMAFVQLQIDHFESQMQHPLESTSSDWPYLDEVMKQARRAYSEL